MRSAGAILMGFGFLGLFFGIILALRETGHLSNHRGYQGDLFMDCLPLGGLAVFTAGAILSWYSRQRT